MGRCRGFPSTSRPSSGPSSWGRPPPPTWPASSPPGGPSIPYAAWERSRCTGPWGAFWSWGWCGRRGHAPPLRAPREPSTPSPLRAEAWLQTPLGRLPEARVLLRLKLALHLLLGRDPRPFLLAQGEAYRALLQRLGQEAEGTKGLGRVYALWWREMAVAGLRYVEALLEEGF